MVALSPAATCSPYSLEELNRRKVMSRRQFNQDWPFRLEHCLPWSDRPSRELLEQDGMDRLLLALNQVFEIGIGKTILLEEHGNLWMVHVAAHPN